MCQTVVCQPPGRGSLRWAEGRVEMAEVKRQQVHLPSGRRGVLHKVRVTAEQEAVLVAKANRHGWTVARLLAESALRGSAEDAAAVKRLTGELFDLQRAFAAVGNNLNQIARATNATLEAQPETDGALQAVGRVCVRIEMLLGDVERSR